MAGLSLTVDERIAALERRVADAEFYADVSQIKREDLEREVAELKARKITVADLPLAALIRSIEKAGMLDASLALLPGTVTPDLLAAKAA